MRAAATVPPKEVTLAKQAVEVFNKGLNLLKDVPQSTFAEESIRATQELEEYGVAVDIQLNRGLSQLLFNEAIKHIEEARKVKPEVVDLNADIQSLYGSCLFNKARLASQQGDEQESKRLLDKAIEILLKAETMHGDPGDAKTLETLGQAYMMSTVMTQEDDLIMEAYSAATERLYRALKLDPSNNALRRQLEAIEAQGGGDDSEEDEYYEEDEEGEEAEDDDRDKDD
ncbi:hypothetical protein BGZ94_005648 [Podila epigama]|nr:hypothetical protein BGZ94_005648 [Podila epigama]